MENEVDVVEIVFVEIDIIMKEQLKIFSYNAELEDRRLRLMDFIKHSEHLKVSKELRENMTTKASSLEIKVVRKHEPPREDVSENKNSKKCRYDNKGFCKFQKKCKFFHSGKICEKYIQEGKCDLGQSCLCRHPKECKYWLRDSKGCTRAECCKYLHKMDSKRPETQGTNTKEDVSDFIHVIKESDNGTKEITELKEEINVKDDMIKVLEEKEKALKNENETLKAQVEKLKIIATNMHKELKEIQSKRS